MARLFETPAGFVVLAGVLAGLPWLGMNLFDQQLALQVILYAVLVVGLNLTFGYAGELSFSQPALFAVGAYLGGYLAIHGTNDVLATCAISAVAAGAAGAVIGLPALRLSGWAMAMVSFFVILVLPDLINLLQNQTGGTSGLAGVPQPKLLGAQLDAGQYFAAAVLVSALVILLVRNLVISRHGRAFRVLRESPVLAQSLGISVYWLKVRAYVIGSATGGVAGALFAYLFSYVSPTNFGFDTAIAIIAASVIGGTRSIYGALFGAAIVEIGPFVSTGFQQYSLVAYGVLLVAAGVLLPLGLGTLTRRGLEPLVARIRGASLTAAGLPAAGPAPLPPDQKGSASGAPAEVRPDGARRRSLRVEELSKTFGGVRALDGVTLEAPPGQVTGVIGPNGSGKTTLLNLVAGVYPPSDGRIVLGGTVLSPRQARRSLRNGVARTFQTPSIPVELTTLEVVMTARYRLDYVGVLATMLRFPRYRRTSRRDEAAAREALGAVGIAELAAVEASSLPLGTRRLVEVARALAARPDVMLLDEPASGLSEVELRRLAEILSRFRQTGGSVVLVEHNFGFVSTVADTVHVLDLGRLVATGTPAELRQHPEVVQSYLGRRHGTDRQAGVEPPAGAVRPA